MKSSNAWTRFGASLLMGFALRSAPALAQPSTTEPTPAQESPDAAPTGALPPTQAMDTTRGFSGVGVESLEDLRSLVIEGPQDQVEAVIQIIEEIDRQSERNAPQLEIVPLEHADSEALAKLLTSIYATRETARGGEATNRGTVGFVAVAQPNSVVIVAQFADMEEAVELVRELDQRSAEAGVQFRTFPLKRAPAIQVQQKLATFFLQRDDAAGMRVRVEVVADERTNSVLVYGGPNDLDQAALVIEQLDGDLNSATVELRVFPLENALATELALLLQQAIVTRSLAAGGQAQGQGGLGQGAIGGQPGQQLGAQAQQLGAQGLAGRGGLGNQSLLGVIKSSKIRFVTTTEDGKTDRVGDSRGHHCYRRRSHQRADRDCSDDQHEPDGFAHRTSRSVAEPVCGVEGLHIVERRCHGDGC